jgi:hypothetical protein
MVASAQVHTWAAGTSWERICVIHRLQWWEDLWRGRGCVVTKSGKVRLCPCQSRNAITHTHTERWCLRYLSLHVHARTSLYILRACKQSPKILMLSEAAFKAHITFSNTERFKKMQTNLQYPCLLCSWYSFPLWTRWENWTKFGMSVTPLEDTPRNEWRS